MSMRYVGPNTPCDRFLQSYTSTHHGDVEERNYTQNFIDMNHDIITAVISCDDGVQGSKQARIMNSPSHLITTSK